EWVRHPAGWPADGAMGAAPSGVVRRRGNGCDAFRGGATGAAERMRRVPLVLGVLIVAAVGVGLAVVRAGETSRGRVASSAGRGRLRSPATGLAVVTGLVYLNQVLF